MVQSQVGTCLRLQWRAALGVASRWESRRQLPVQFVQDRPGVRAEFAQRTVDTATLREGRPVEIAGVAFRPGAHVWADADGILVER